MKFLIVVTVLVASTVFPVFAADTCDPTQQSCVPGTIGPGGVMNSTGGAPLPGSSTGTGSNQISNSGPITIQNPIGVENLEDLVNKIGGTLVNLAIPIAVIMIIWAGVQFLIAGGNAEMIGKAKKTLWWSVIGLAVIFIGKGFITLIQDILSLKDG